MNSPSQHSKPTSVEIYVATLSVCAQVTQYSNLELTVVELHIALTGDCVSVVAVMCFATMFVAAWQRRDAAPVSVKGLQERRSGRREMLYDMEVSTYQCWDTGQR